MNRRRSVHGFSLLEVLVALAVASLGMLAVYRGAIQAGANASMLREQTLAHWVAMNRLTELRLEREWPDVGTSDGKVEYAGTEWAWNAEVSETQVESLRRVDVDVAHIYTEEKTLVSLSGFIGRPMERGTPIPWTGVIAPDLDPDGDGDETP